MRLYGRFCCLFANFLNRSAVIYNVRAVPCLKLIDSGKKQKYKYITEDATPLGKVRRPSLGGIASRPTFRIPSTCAISLFDMSVSFPDGRVVDLQTQCIRSGISDGNLVLRQFKECLLWMCVDYLFNYLLIRLYERK